MKLLKRLEFGLRGARDLIVKPLAQSDVFKRHAYSTMSGAILDFGDHRLAFDPNDKIIGTGIRRHGGWFRQESCRIFDALPEKGGAFIDVGANIGTQTVYALKFGGFERAVCFEPDPRNLWLLRANVSINDLADRVTIIEAAAGAYSGTVPLFLNSFHSGTNSIAVDQGEGTIDVAMVSVESALADLGISGDQVGLAWIDVEGYEGEVLKGWPSVAGKPLCVEYSPEVRRLHPDAFAGWSKWADVRGALTWKPIQTLDLTAYDSQQDFLLA